jgi:fermentation-respiration switch protein FrsA (DUF1100 family)
VSGTPEEIVAAGDAESAVAVRRRRPWWFRTARTLVVAYLFWMAILYLGQDTLLFKPYLAKPPHPPTDPRTIVTELPLDEGGSVISWFIPALGVDEQHPGPAVVVLHGNAESIYQQKGTVQSYHELGVSVLLPEYRGYAGSGGKPSEKGIVADMVRFYDEMVRLPHVDASRIVFHGRSLGGGVAAQLAARRRPRALILESTFTSVAIRAHDYFVPSFLARNPFRTDAVIGDFDFPILIFHGAHDTVIPVDDGRRLAELAPHARYVEYEEVGHDLPSDRYWPAYREEIERFLRETGVTATPAATEPVP